MKIYEALEIGNKILKQKKIFTSSLDSEILMGEILNKKGNFNLKSKVELNQ